MNKKIKIALLVLLSLMMIAVICYSPVLQASLDTSFNTGRTLNDINFRGLVFDSRGLLWGLGPYSIATLEGDSWIVYEPPDSDVPPATFTSLTSDKNGNIWIGTIENGLIKFDGKNWTAFTTQNSNLAADGWIRRLYTDKEDRIWIAYKSGATVFDGTIWTTYNTSNSGLPQNSVSAIAFDSKNRAWFATSAGLSVFDGKQWITYTSSNSGLASDEIDDITFGQDGRAWIGFREGINIFDGEQWKFITSREIGVDTGFYEGCRIFFDQLGRAWVWHWREEVHILDKGTWISLLEPDGSEALVDDSIVMDAQGNIYITTYEGLVKLARDYPLDSVQRSRQIRAFLARGGIVFIEIILAGLILAILIESSTLALVWVLGNLIIFSLSPVFVLPYEGPPFFRIGISLVCATIGAIVGAFVGIKKARHSQKQNQTKFEAFFIGLIGGYVVGIFLLYAIAIILFEH